jgi:hypothetical protein
MTFNLDFALFYAYTLALFAFLAIWLISQLGRALVTSVRSWRATRRPPRLQPRAGRALTRLEAFTRL